MSDWSRPSPAIGAESRTRRQPARGRACERIEDGLTALVLPLGAWAFYAQVLVLLQASFATLRTFSFVPVAIGAWAWIALRRARARDEDTADAMGARDAPSAGGALSFWPPFAIAALYGLTKSDWVFWGLAAGYVVLEAWRGARRDNSAAPSARDLRDNTVASPSTNLPEDIDSRRQTAALFALCALAGILTAGTVQPDDDDAYYVSVAIAATEFPAAAPQSFDAMHRDGLPPVEQTLHLPQVYEVLVGLLSSISGVSVATLYYVVLPPLWAVAGTLATWLVIRSLLPARAALAGTAMFVFLLVVWSGERTYGDFGFVRLFHGKAIYVTVVLPLVVFSAFRYRQRRSTARWLALALTQLAAAGLTVNAVVVAPIAAALVLVSRPHFNRQYLRRVLVGLGASVPIVLIAAMMYPRMAPYRSLALFDDVRLGHAAALGATRAPLVLLALLLLPALAARARLRHAAWIAGYVAIIVGVLLMPGVSMLATHLRGQFYSWRLLWAVPMPLLVSLAAGCLVSDGRARAGGWRWGAALAAWVAVFACAGPPAISPGIWSLRDIVRPKVIEAHYEVAREVNALARTDAHAIAPESVAVYLTGFRGGPPLIGVRELYLRKLSGFVPADRLQMRLALFKYAESPEASRRFPWESFEPLTAERALAAIESEGIATIVFPEGHADAPVLVPALTERGFMVRRVRGHVIAALLK